MVGRMSDWNKSLDAFSSRFWIGWVTRCGDKCVPSKRSPTIWHKTQGAALPASLRFFDWIGLGAEAAGKERPLSLGALKACSQVFGTKHSAPIWSRPDIAR
jgi:hypothetical protein